MIASVENQFSRLEKQRRKLLSEISTLTHEQLNFKPGTDSWSILQVLNHLIFAETNTVKYLQKKILGIDKVKKADLNSRFRSFALKLFLKSPLKFKAPKAANPQQEEIYFFDDLQKQWNDVRQKMQEVLENLDKSSADKLLFKHPIMGYFNIQQTLSFIDDHICHHEKQIERLKRAQNLH